MKKIKALSFFSGAMGLDIGLEKAGIDVILACESEKFIRETIKLNRPKIQAGACQIKVETAKKASMTTQ